MSDFQVGDVVRYAGESIGLLSGTVWLVDSISANGLVCSPVFVPAAYERTTAVHFKSYVLEKIPNAK